ncbi:hypothetical protein EV178_003045 [Coemansia sp. RSA 1646]|nr:hypothetical protein EV178_003045 [Coemansia sp. RSA 1646]
MQPPGSRVFGCGDRVFSATPNLVKADTVAAGAAEAVERLNGSGTSPYSSSYKDVNDCLALGGVGSLKPDRKLQVSDIEESIFQNVLQLERDLHNKVTNVLILMLPPAKDMPMAKHDKPNVHAVVLQATASLARNLPHTLFEKTRATYPITHYITVDLSHNYNHLLPHEHNGTHPAAPSTSASGSPLHLHPVPSTVAGLGHPSVKLHKRSAVTSSIGHAVQSTASGGGATRLRILVYDAYGFIKHAEENPLCCGFGPAMMNKTCGEQLHCHDCVWINDSDVGAGVHYWMARDINTRLHIWHMHNAGINLERFFKNSTRAKELELDGGLFSCPAHAAPTDF